MDALSNCYCVGATSTRNGISVLLAAILVCCCCFASSANDKQWIFLAVLSRLVVHHRRFDRAWRWRQLLPSHLRHPGNNQLHYGQFRGHCTDKMPLII